MNISIITVVRNGEATIGECMASVLQQTRKPSEYIIIDGRSTDRTIEIVSTFVDDGIKLVSEPDSGIYDAMNKGLNLSTGDIIGILNSDDFYAHPYVLEKVLKAFLDEKVDACYSDIIYVNSHHTKQIVRYWKSGDYKRRKIYHGWMPPHPSFFVRKKIYDRFGRFNTKLEIAADYELMLRFLVKYNIYCTYIPEVLIRMRSGGESNRNLKNIFKANLESYNAWKNNGLSINPLWMLCKPAYKALQYLKAISYR